MIHSLYSDKTIVNDLAIIKLATPFTLNAYVATMALPASTASFASGLSCTASGWGYATAGNIQFINRDT